MPDNTCPDCGAKGMWVEPTTIRSLVSHASADDGFSFCATPSCAVAYFRPETGATIAKTDVRVPIFQKETDPDRLVCYCFEHSVAAITEEVRRTGTSVVPKEIGDKCKAGLDRCEELNPQGRCCLSSVHHVVKDAQRDGVLAEEQTDCCGASNQPVEESSTVVDRATKPADEVGTGNVASDQQSAAKPGLWAAGGAVGAAVLSSACCWLPLLAIGAGASVAGVTGIFEAYRLYLVLGAAGLLGVGFYFVYRRQPECAPGSACAAPNAKVVRFNRVLLWIAAAAVGLFAFFPSYAGVALGGGEPVAEAKPVARGAATYILTIEGMTCESCVHGLQAALRKLAGVQSAVVTYATREARVVVSDGGPDAEALARVVESVGYKVVSVKSLSAAKT